MSVRGIRVSAVAAACAAALLLGGLAGCGRGSQAGGGSQSSGADVQTAGSGGRTGAGSNSEMEEELHPAFSLTRSELDSLLATSSPEIRRRILSRPQYFLELIDQALELPDFALLLVDKQHALSADYAPPTLVSLDRFQHRLALNKEGMELRREVLPWLAAMSQAAELDGVKLLVSSAYRSYAYQEDLFNYWVRELGEDDAARVSARPGESQHQLGTTVDFGSITPEFAETEASAWLAEHAWRYGFSLSYPEGYEAETGYSYESWHYRYITPTGTRLEREFFGGIQQRMLEYLNANRSALERTRR